MFVLHFNGSMNAQEVEQLREEITAILCVATKDDEVLVNVESGGGVVHGYGLGASQLQRIKDKQIKLTVSVDKTIIKASLV
jgi:serine protease SohB